MARRFSKARETAIVDAYEAWDADQETIAELCARMSISRQGLYQVLARNGIAFRGNGRLPSDGRDGAQDSLVQEMANKALRTMIDELTMFRQQVIDLTERNAALEAELRDMKQQRRKVSSNS